MSILKVEDDAEEMYEVSSVRIGALKLLTSIVTIDQFGSTGAHLLCWRSQSLIFKLKMRRKY